MKIRISGIIALSLTIIFSACGGKGADKKAPALPQTRETTGWEKAGLKGRVKTVIRKDMVDRYNELGDRVEELAYGTDKTIFTYDNRGNQIEAAYFNEDGRTNGKTVYSYDAAGRQTESRSLDSTEGLTSRDAWKYDDRGNMIALEMYNYDDELTNSRLYTYDEKGFLVEELQPEIEKRVYKNDAEGRRIEDAWYEMDGTLNLRTVYAYDAKGNRTLMADYLPDGRISRKFVTKYDEAGNKVEDSYYNEYGKMGNTYSYEYDSQGRLIAETYIEFADPWGRKTLYEYDDQGNMVKASTYDLDPSSGKLGAEASSVEEIQYEYFD